MLAVARQRAADEHATITFAVGDAHALEFPDRAFDVAVSFRVLMHTPQWRVCLGELCRVADRLVVIDYPSRASVAWLQAAARRAVSLLGRAHGSVSRVLRSRDRRRACAARIPGPFAAPAVRAANRPSQGRRVTPIHGRLRVALEPDWPAEPLRLPGHARRRTVHALVTGATGFTGSHLARALAARGQTVRALVREAGRARDLEAEGIQLAVGDIRDRAALEAATAGVEVVYHLAAIYRQAGVKREVYQAVNASAVRDIVEAAARAGVRRVVHCSTVGVHGDIEHPPANEDAPLRPGDPYQISKLEGERLARETGERLGIEVTIARPSGIYGPGDRRLLKLFRGVARRRFPMLGHGEIYYHLTHIDDLVEGFRLCGEQPAAAGRTYILAGGEYTTLNQLVALIAEVAGVPPPRLYLPVWPFWIAGALCEALSVPIGVEPPIYRRRVDFYTKSRAFDISRARRELGYEPRVGLRQGIERTLTWYRDHGWI